jgi:glutathione S-transferase
MVLSEKGLTPEVRQIDLRGAENLSPAFLAVNPRGTVPVLVTDEGTVLTENLGIAAYLEARFPQVPLLGRSPDETGLVWMWTAIAEQQGGAPMAEALRNGSPAMKDRAVPGPVPYAQIPELAERGRARVARFFEHLNDRLGQSPWLAVDEFSLADLTAYVFVDYCRVIRMKPAEDQSALRDWMARIAERPSAQA